MTGLTTQRSEAEDLNTPEIEDWSCALAHEQRKPSMVSTPMTMRAFNPMTLSAERKQ